MRPAGAGPASPALILTTVLSIGCVPATIYRPNAPPLVAVIESSDSSTLHVRTKEGTEMTLNQFEVAEIDHPGNVPLLMGLSFLAVGLGMFALVRAETGGWPEHPLGWYLPLLFTGTGAGYTVVGGAFWARSRLAARPFNAARPPMPPVDYPMFSR